MLGIRRISTTLLLLSLSTGAFAQQQRSTTSAAPQDREALEKQLAQTLTDARLTGYYTIEGQQGPPKEDQYTLTKVEKREGDKWLFTAVIAFGKQPMSIPLEIPVLWAGDTPVISVTDFQVPGLGTYTARVMIYRDHYAGTWSGANHGGYLWGRVQHIDKKATTHSAEPSKK